MSKHFDRFIQIGPRFVWREPQVAIQSLRANNFPMFVLFLLLLPCPRAATWRAVYWDERKDRTECWHGDKRPCTVRWSSVQNVMTCIVICTCADELCLVTTDSCWEKTSLLVKICPCETKTTPLALHRQLQTTMKHKNNKNKKTTTTTLSRLLQKLTKNSSQKLTLAEWTSPAPLHLLLRPVTNLLHSKRLSSFSYLSIVVVVPWFFVTLLFPQVSYRAPAVRPEARVTSDVRPQQLCAWTREK